MAKGGGIFLKDQEHERLVKEREEAERDALSRVPEDKRDWFRKQLLPAQPQGRACLDPCSGIRQEIAFRECFVAPPTQCSRVLPPAKYSCTATN